MAKRRGNGKVSATAQAQRIAQILDGDLSSLDLVVRLAESLAENCRPKLPR